MTQSMTQSTTQSAAQPSISPLENDGFLSRDRHVIALVAEQLKVDIRSVETGRVRIGTRVVQTQQVVDPPLLRDDVEIERVSINQAVDHPAAVREENGVTIVPVYEEVLVVTKQLVLKEELRITRRSSAQAAQPQHFTLRHEEVTISRHPAAVATLLPEPVTGQ